MEADKEWLESRVRTHLRDSANLKLQVAEQCMGSILAAARLVADSFRAGGKLLLCGNGGSAADCQHLAAEFVSRLTAEFHRPGLPAIALTTDTSFITAHANDYSFEDVFERQVEVLGKAGDVLMGISTSGNSANVIRAMVAARGMGIGTIALVGRDGRMVRVADIAIRVPSDNTQYIQEAHLAVEHAVCDLAERYLFGRQPLAEETLAAPRPARHRGAPRTRNRLAMYY